MSTLRTVQAFVGLPVIERATGIEKGRVIDGLLFESRIIGFLVQKRRLFSHTHFLSVDAVTSAGSEAMMIEHACALEPVSHKHKQCYSIVTGKRRFRGKPLLSSEGETLGLVEDVYFDVELGTIEGYEVTDGWLSDITEGRKIVRGKDLVISKDRAVLSL